METRQPTETGRCPVDPNFLQVQSGKISEKICVEVGLHREDSELQL